MEEPSQIDKKLERLVPPPKPRSVLLGLSLLSLPGKMFGFVLRYWKQCFIIGLVVAVLYQNFSPTRYLLWIDTIPYLRNQVTELETQNDEMQKANELLVVRIRKTNETILDWKKKSDVLQAKLNKLNDSIIEHQEEVAIDVAEILAEPAPVTCEESINYLLDATEDLKWDIK